MPFFGWIRDLFGIQKDMYETKKTRLEIEKIEDENRKKLITPASLKDVEKYDPKIKAIEAGMRHRTILAFVLLCALLFAIPQIRKDIESIVRRLLSW
jgi:O-phosphoseryl-tRNA(Cys) synthetase